MRAESFPHRHSTGKLPATTLEDEFLELFAMTQSSTSANALPLHNEINRLLRTDAIHRANNLAHMSIFVADLGDHSKRSWLPNEMISHARGLAHAYEELGTDQIGQAPVPCAELLTEIVTRLAFMFGRSRKIAISVRADPVLLPPDVRRALILISSELVINSLNMGIRIAPAV